MATTPRTYEPENDASAAWAVIWVLFAFKLITAGLIFYHMATPETGLLLGATTWYWFPLVGVLVAGPLLFRYRLRRVRAKREELRRQEWMLDPERGVDAPASACR